MPEPVSQQQIDQALARWNTLLPGDQRWETLAPKKNEPGFLIGDSERRAAAVQGLRAFTELMESRPDIPLPTFIFATVSLSGTTTEKRAQLEHAADLLGKPVTPCYREPDVFDVDLDFGPVKYSLSARPAQDTNPTPVFAARQEVRLITGASHVMKAAGLSQIGTVVGSEPDPSPYGGNFLYTVHFPGRLGTQRGWAERDLTPAPWFRPVGTLAGWVTSLQEAEDHLIKLGAEIKRRELSGRQPDDELLSDQSLLADAVSRACGLSSAELLRQVEPQVEERIRGDVTQHGPELGAPSAAPELAVGGGQHATAAAEGIPAQRDKQQAGRRPATERARGKKR